MIAEDLYRNGQLSEAIESLGSELREAPADIRRRTFLFELLCFAGEYERAQKQLDALANLDPDSTSGYLSYRAALDCSREREEVFMGGAFPETGEAPPSGSFNGAAFEKLEDADPRIGARLEVFVHGQYHLLPFEHIKDLSVEEPRQLRDLFWAPATITCTDALGGNELDALLPLLTADAYRHADPDVRLGRATAWRDTEDGVEVPVGHKMFVIDDEDVPLLKLRDLVIQGRSD